MAYCEGDGEPQLVWIQVDGELTVRYRGVLPDGRPIRLQLLGRPEARLNPIFDLVCDGLFQARGIWRRESERMARRS